MKVICKIRAFYNDRIVKPGEVINFKGKKCPSWAEEVNEGGNNEVKDGGTAGKPAVENNQPVSNQENILENKNDEELNKLADELLTKALDNGITIDTTNKTVKQIVDELQNLLKEVV